ncbi:MAG: hypothetical protein H0X47_17775 [Nitrospirales bacterium]|nr:hypothetical protein [Nitrospirales bacterium]
MPFLFPTPPPTAITKRDHWVDQLYFLSDNRFSAMSTDLTPKIGATPTGMNTIETSTDFCRHALHQVQRNPTAGLLFMMRISTLIRTGSSNPTQQYRHTLPVRSVPAHTYCGPIQMRVFA